MLNIPTFEEEEDFQAIGDPDPPKKLPMPCAVTRFFSLLPHQ